MFSAICVIGIFTAAILLFFSSRSYVRASRISRQRCLCGYPLLTVNDTKQIANDARCPECGVEYKSLVTAECQLPKARLRVAASIGVMLIFGLCFLMPLQIFTLLVNALPISMVERYAPVSLESAPTSFELAMLDRLARYVDRETAGGRNYSLAEYHERWFNYVAKSGIDVSVANKSREDHKTILINLSNDVNVPLIRMSNLGLAIRVEAEDKNLVDYKINSIDYGRHVFEDVDFDHSLWNPVWDYEDASFQPASIKFRASDIGSNDFRIVIEIFPIPNNSYSSRDYLKNYQGNARIVYQHVYHCTYDDVGVECSRGN